MRTYFYIVIGLLALINKQAVAQHSGNSEREMARSSVLIPGDNIEQRIKENIFIRVETNKKTCFVGEPLLATYKLCTRLQSQSKVVDPPTFTGCSVIEMTTNQLKEEEEIINGKAFRTYTIRKVQLIPLQEGILNLGITTVDNELQFYNYSSGSYTPLTKKVQLTNTASSVQINPLPVIDTQQIFNGAVGSFFMVTKVSKPKDTANDNNELEITVTGNGNFANLSCPAINWPTDIQPFEPKVSELIDKLTFPMLGSKKFTIPFTCKKTGLMVIPKISFTFFDAATARYTTAETDSINIQVLPAAPIIDSSKLSGTISNVQYIWIVPAIALVAGIGLLLVSIKKKKMATENMPDSTTNNAEE